MDFLEIRTLIQDLLAEKLSLEQGKFLFCGSFPPGAAEGVAVKMTGILPHTPEEAPEYTLEISGMFEDEARLAASLNTLTALFHAPCPVRLLHWEQTGPIQLDMLPGDNMDRFTFLMPILIAAI